VTRPDPPPQRKAGEICGLAEPIDTVEIKIREQDLTAALQILEEADSAEELPGNQECVQNNSQKSDYQTS
jgi:hypothetical protein